MTLSLASAHMDLSFSRSVGGTGSSRMARAASETLPTATIAAGRDRDGKSNCLLACKMGDHLERTVERPKFGASPLNCGAMLNTSPEACPSVAGSLQPSSQTPFKKMCAISCDGRLKPVSAKL